MVLSIMPTAVWAADAEGSNSAIRYDWKDYEGYYDSATSGEVAYEQQPDAIGILAGTVLAFARALGEYGATSMIAGYTPGRTATISTTVYQLWRTNDDAQAFLWVLVNLAISFVVLLAVNMLEKREGQHARGGR